MTAIPKADIKFNVEYTDTFGGEANYCWVKRATISAPYDPTTSLVMRRAKASVGLSGVRGVTSNLGDTIEFRPYGMATVMFVTWADEMCVGQGHYTSGKEGWYE